MKVIPSKTDLGSGRLVPLSAHLPSIIKNSGPKGSERFFDFFTANTEAR